MPKAQCDICKAILPTFNAAAKHAGTHDPIVRKPTANGPLFKVGWKKDGTIRQPKGEK